MPSVRCPNCDTAQHVGSGARDYRCSSCGEAWAFVVCRSCGSRFHARPGATTWTCPRCGLLQEASGEPPPPAPPEPVVAPTPLTITDADLDVPREPPGSMFPPGLGLGSDEEGPEDAFAMPTRESPRRPVWVYVAGAAVAIVLAFVLFRVVFGGDGDEPDPAGDPGTQVSAEQATETMCGRVRQIQTFRADALGAAAEQLRGDAKALKQAGAPQTARQVRSLIAAIGDAREALATQGNTDEPFAALQAAITKLPC